MRSKTGENNDGDVPSSAMVTNKLVKFCQSCDLTINILSIRLAPPLILSSIFRIPKIHQYIESTSICTFKRSIILSIIKNIDNIIDRVRAALNLNEGVFSVRISFYINVMNPKFSLFVLTHIFFFSYCT